MTAEPTTPGYRLHPAAIARAAGPLAVENVREIQELLADQVQSGQRRLLASLEAAFAEPGPAGTSRVWTVYLAESAQASARNLVSWNQLFVRACGKAMTSVLDATPAVDASADA